MPEPLARILLPPSERSWETFAEMVEPTVPSLIGGGIVASSGMTLLFAKQGTGKGTVCAAVCARLVQEGYKVLVVDWERHPEEWFPRIRGLLKPEQWSMVAHCKDDFLESDIVRAFETIQIAIQDFGATAIIIDSYAFAVPQVANKSVDPLQVQALQFAKTVSKFGIPALVTTHVTKAPGRKTEPYGSVYLPAAARLTWGLTKSEKSQGNELVVELTHYKANSFPTQATKEITFYYNDDDIITSYKWDDVGETLVARIKGALAQLGIATWQEVHKNVQMKYRKEFINAQSVKVTLYNHSKPEGPRTYLFDRVDGGFCLKGTKR